MAEVVADHHDATVTSDYFALVTNLFNAWFDLHFPLLLNLLLTCTDKQSDLG